MSVLNLRIVIRSWQWRFRRDKKLFRPSVIRTWVVVIYESQGRFRPETAREMVQGFIQGAISVGKCIHYVAFFIAVCSEIDWSHAGMTVVDNQPPIFWENGQGNISEVIYLFIPWNIWDADVTFLSLSNWRRLARPASNKKEVHLPWSSPFFLRAAMKSIRLLRSEQYIHF